MHTYKQVVSINGVSTLLLTSGEVEQMLLGPEGSTCVLTLASDRFNSPDGTSVVELVRHSLPATQALI